MPWIFPDQAIRMNTLGVQSMRPTHIAPFNGEVGQFSSWSDDARKVALDRVRNTQTAQRGMEGHLNTTARSQRYDRAASRSAVPNGIFDGSPMEYLTSAGLRGGRIYTKEGQEWLAKRLKERAGEYEALSTGNFSAGPPAPIQVSPYTTVDTLLTQIFAAFGTGSFTSSVASDVNKLIGELIKIGATITPSQLTKYAQAIQKLVETIRGYRGGEVGIEYDRPNIGEQIIGEPARAPIYNPAEERLRLVESMQNSLKIINGVIREIARTINDPLSGRQQVMSTLSERLLGEQIVDFNPEFAGEERQAAIRGVPGVEMGVRAGPTLTGPTFGEMEQERQAGEEFGRNFEQGNAGPGEGEYGGPPAMNEEEAYGQGRKRRSKLNHSKIRLF